MLPSTIYLIFFLSIFIITAITMAAQEARAFRTASKRCTTSELRNRLFEGLISQKIGLKEIEDSVWKEGNKSKGGNNFDNKSGRKIVMLFMKEKLRDNIREGVILRKRREYARRKV